MDCGDISWGARFGKGLKTLAKKHADIEDEVTRVLDACAEGGPPDNANQIRNLGGLPVFKQRLRLGNRGARSGARVIYFCDDKRVVALFVFSKGTQEDIAPKEILDALAASRLVQPHNGAPTKK